jgi:hypothetical protein
MLTGNQRGISVVVSPPFGGYSISKQNTIVPILPISTIETDVSPI